MTVYVLDHYYLLITLLITIGWQMTGFFIAWTFQFDKVTDFTGGSNFFVLALVTMLFGGTYNARNIVATVLQLVWAIRIGGFLLYRVLKLGADNRFDKIRGHFFSFLTFWIAQIGWVWIVSFPVIILNSPAVSRNPGGNPDFGTAGDIIGIILWAIGLAVEAISDQQKFIFKTSNPSREKPCTKGLWRWSRHPPYFGEITLWWGMWALCLSPTMNGNLPMHVRSAQLGAMVSPLITMFILIFGSGIPYAEKPTAEKMYLMSNGPDAEGEDGEKKYPHAWKNYKNYVDSTSILFPIPPSIWRPLPKFVKALLFDLPMFHFDEEKDGKKAIEEARSKKESERA